MVKTFSVWEIKHFRQLGQKAENNKKCNERLVARVLDGDNGNNLRFQSLSPSIHKARATFAWERSDFFYIIFFGNGCRIISATPVFHRVIPNCETDLQVSQLVMESRYEGVSGK